jgi:hypothetical protein
LIFLIPIAFRHQLIYKKSKVNAISTRRERISHPKERKFIKYFVLFFLLLILKPFSDMIIGSTLTILLIILVVLHFTYGIKKSCSTLYLLIRQIFEKQTISLKRVLILLGIAFIGILLIALIVVGNEVSDQSVQLNKLTQKIDLIEKKLGGDKKLNCNEKDTIDRVRKSVVRIIGGEAEGSGFAIQSDGYILTNFHVIEFEPTPKVIFPDNSFETAEIVMADKNADLAILKVNKQLPPISWGVPEELNPAEELLAIGFPLGGELSGEASVNKGALAGRRRSKDVGVEYLQTDITLTGGVSGGPMVNICGEVEGINTSGLAGLGMAISSKSILQKWNEMTNSKEDVLKDIQRITFDPDASPLESVRAFYNYLKARKLDKAFDLISDNYKRGYKFTTWKKGYESLLDTTVIKIENDPTVKDRVNVKLSTKDMVDGEIVYKYFEGYWDVKEVTNRWQLWDPKIKEVKEPDYLWYYD